MHDDYFASVNIVDGPTPGSGQIVHDSLVAQHPALHNPVTCRWCQLAHGVLADDATCAACNAVEAENSGFRVAVHYRARPHEGHDAD